MGMHLEPLDDRPKADENTGLPNGAGSSFSEKGSNREWTPAEIETAWQLCEWLSTSGADAFMPFSLERIADYRSDWAEFLQDPFNMRQLSKILIVRTRKTSSGPLALYWVKSSPPKWDHVFAQRFADNMPDPLLRAKYIGKKLGFAPTREMARSATSPAAELMSEEQLRVYWEMCCWFEEYHFVDREHTVRTGSVDTGERGVGLMFPEVAFVFKRSGLEGKMLRRGILSYASGVWAVPGWFLLDDWQIAFKHIFGERQWMKI